jgi:hypothetical protein
MLTAPSVTVTPAGGAAEVSEKLTLPPLPAVAAALPRRSFVSSWPLAPLASVSVSAAALMGVVAGGSSPPPPPQAARRRAIEKAESELRADGANVW